MKTDLTVCTFLEVNETLAHLSSLCVKLNYGRLSCVEIISIYERISVKKSHFFCGSFKFLFCLVFAMFCARLFICALWSPAGKGLTSWLSFVVSTVSLSLSHWYPGSGVVLDCIDSWSLHTYLLHIWAVILYRLAFLTCQGAQWLSDRVLDTRPRGCKFDP